MTSQPPRLELSYPDGNAIITLDGEVVSGPHQRGTPWLSAVDSALGRRGLVRTSSFRLRGGRLFAEVR